MQEITLSFTWYRFDSVGTYRRAVRGHSMSKWPPNSQGDSERALLKACRFNYHLLILENGVYCISMRRRDHRKDIQAAIWFSRGLIIVLSSQKVCSTLCREQKLVNFQAYDAYEYIGEVRRKIPNDPLCIANHINTPEFGISPHLSSLNSQCFGDFWLWTSLWDQHRCITMIGWESILGSYPQ